MQGDINLNLGSIMGSPMGEPSITVCRKSEASRYAKNHINTTPHEIFKQIL